MHFDNPTASIINEQQWFLIKIYFLDTDKYFDFAKKFLHTKWMIWYCEIYNGHKTLSAKQTG